MFANNRHNKPNLDAFSVRHQIIFPTVSQRSCRAPARVSLRSCSAADPADRSRLTSTQQVQEHLCTTTVDSAHLVHASLLVSPRANGSKPPSCFHVFLQIFFLFEKQSCLIYIYLSVVGSNHVQSIHVRPSGLVSDHL